MKIPATRLRAHFLPGLTAFMITGNSFLRGLRLLVSARPGTPLRGLCLIAFDTHHVLRKGRHLSWPKIKLLVALLDFGACVNAALDRKPYDRKAKRAAQQSLHESGMDELLLEYLQRLRGLEHGRPCVGGDPSHFHKVRLYREAVIRLSLGMVATIAADQHGLEEGIRATHSDVVLEILFRVVMQCQMIDDVFDYHKDKVAGLPGFLTASESFPESIHLARATSTWYADATQLPRTADTLPFRAALMLISVATRFFISVRTLMEAVRAGQRKLKPLSGSRLLVPPSYGVRSPTTMQP